MEQMWDCFPFPRILCTTSVKKARRFVKEMTGGECKYSKPTKDAQASLYDGSVTGEYFCVIYVPKIGKSTVSKLALLSHEVSHIVDFIEEYIGEEKLGTETRAYMTQACMTACLNQLGEEWLTQRQ